MFYEIVKELTKVRTGSTIWKLYGESFHREILGYDKGTIDKYNKQLSVTKNIAQKLDVPVDFIISILSYGGVDELDTIGRTTSEASRDTKEKIFL